MSISKKNSHQEFDQSVCFTCFAPWVESIRMMAEDSPETALRAFLTLSDYCLYGINPEAETNPWGAVWPIVEGEARRSINNRRRGFGSEDVALSDAIREYHSEHPEASQRAIAEALGCSVGKVNKTLRRAPGATDDGAVDGIGTNVHNDISNDIDTLSLHVVEQNECEVFGFPIGEEAAL